MRIRSRQLGFDSTGISGEFLHFNGPTHQWDVSGLFTYADNAPSTLRDCQYMADVKSKGVRHYNDCTNVRWQRNFFTVDPITGIRQSYAPGGYIVDTPWNISAGTKAYEVWSPQLIEAAKPHLSRIVGPVLNEDVTRFYNRFLPLFSSTALPRNFTIRSDPFDTDFSAWYLLVDLLDFKKALANLTKRLIKPGRRRRVPHGITARGLHDAHLGVRFGVLPTLRDISDMTRAVKRWHDRSKVIATTEDKRYVSHLRKETRELRPFFEFKDLDWDETVTFSVPSVFPNNGPLTMKVVCATTMSWHAEAVYGFRCPELQGWVSRLGQLVDSFGLADPAALWDVVPFSFIVDWFYCVTDWLHNNRPRFFPVTPVLYDYLETIKVQTRVLYTLTADYAILGATSAPYSSPSTDLLGEERIDTYIRRRFCPDLDYIKLAPRTGRSNASFTTLANRTAISSSLVAQRLPR